MVPKPPVTGRPTALKAPRLPPMHKFRLRRPNKMSENPCITIMSSVLGCWASSGYTTSGCMAMEQQLRACMDAQKAPQKSKSTINYHLARMYRYMKGPHKRG
ncbi:mitochondrial ribosomal protein 10 [Eremomyces bilateralis CBS 781.70]|uniref:Small ribosomal subunit protein mS37 n=1 Tax=Eremomyces bilateralis CBS 781.70 TaxID=1392243 RepID=A0A6G1G2D1_9PEZI|nr:mitochondrial ribosomal protein 10 [Eremomyces bilateralis CBS 781.70]KAF1812203.1 mitochondrial ribosomal protein 10 [Eremomyces bilateralis CBS 781.70]